MGNFEVLCGIIVFLLVLYYYLTANFNFWKKYGLPGPEPMLYFGTMKDLMLGKIFLGIYVKNLYDTYTDTPFIGIFNKRQPILIIRDPDLIRDVLIKDSKLFSTRGVPTFLRAEPLNQFLFFMDGMTAHLLRSKLSPIFTPSKLKDMFDIMLKSTERLDNFLEELNDNQVNYSSLISNLITDMVSNCIISVDMGTLRKGSNEECKFIENLEKISGFHCTHWSATLKRIMKLVWPQLYNLIGYHIFNNTETRFFTELFVDMMKYRKTYNIVKSDIISLFIELKENPGKIAEIIDLTNDFFAAQIFGFFYAAYDTSSSTLNATLYELAFNQNIQDKLRKEIRDKYEENNGKLQYENLNEMPYLNAVFKESLRKYPQASVLTRNSSSSYTFKNTGITIPKHQHVMIPVYAIHHDPKIYPKPEVYDPERFINETIKSRHPMHFIPFGYGSRNCIGERMGTLQTKLGLISILRKYKIDICEKTVTSYDFNTVTFVSKSDNPIILKVTKID